MRPAFDVAGARRRGEGIGGKGNADEGDRHPRDAPHDGAQPERGAEGDAPQVAVEERGDLTGYIERLTEHVGEHDCDAPLRAS